MAERTRKCRCHLTVTSAAARKSTLQPAEELNMAPKLLDVTAIVCVIFLSLIPPAEAYDAGDALALLLGTILAVVGCCACLGWYARRRNGHL